MPPRKQQVLTVADIADQLQAGLKRTIVRPTIYGYQPQEYQRGFHKSCAIGRAFIGGNRSGKTVAGASEITMWATGKHPYRPTPQPPLRLRGVAVDIEKGIKKIMLPEIAKWVPPSMLINGSWEDSYKKESMTLYLTNESFIEFLSYDQQLDQHAGTSRHLVWFDEEPPQDIFNENMARLVDVGGSWILTMTPVEGMSWTYDEIYLKGKTNPHIDVFTASMDQNMYVNSAEIDIYLATMPTEERRARRLGKFVQLGGTVYADKSYTDENIIEPILGSNRWETIRKEWTHILAMDHGFHNPTCWLFIAMDSDGRMIVYDEYYVAGEVVGYHANQILERVKILDIDPAIILGDPSICNVDAITGTSIQIEYAEHDIHIAPANNDVIAGINRTASLFERNRLFIARNCEKLIWELGRYRWARWSSKKVEVNHNPKDTPAKRDDHACDALRYAVASLFSPDVESPSEPRTALGASEARIYNQPLIDKELLAISEPKSHDAILGTEW